MYADNETEVTAFLLLGFNSLQNIKFLLFCLSLTIYIVTISGNVLIISLVSTSHHLHSPMYFFLSHLSLSDLLLTTNVVPNMLHGIIGNGSTISVNGCISQLYFFGVSTVIECFLLTVMSYDRYLAICNPLRYTSIMDLKLQLHLVIWPWLLGFLISLITVITVRSLKFCGPNVINHFFCDLAPLLKLSCSDTTTVEIELLVLSIPIIPLPFVFILGTYVCIFLTIIKIPSSIGRQKAFSTCSSHLIVVGTYYGTLITLYVVPSDGHLSNINKMLSLLYTVVTPLCNPIIYSLRNQELRFALVKFISTRKTMAII